jgi:TPR repeat protein
MYPEGDGVPNDGAEAAIWLRKAADQGNAEAKSALQSMHSEGAPPPVQSK